MSVNLRPRLFFAVDFEVYEFAVISLSFCYFTLFPFPRPFAAGFFLPAGYFWFPNAFSNDSISLRYTLAPRLVEFRELEGDILPETPSEIMLSSYFVDG